MRTSYSSNSKREALSYVHGPGSGVVEFVEVGVDEVVVVVGWVVVVVGVAVVVVGSWLVAINAIAVVVGRTAIVVGEPVVTAWMESVSKTVDQQKCKEFRGKWQ